jgi:hypothetical protein
MVAQISESVAGLASRCSREAGRLWSMVKEEAEKMWDEAQSIRRSDQPPTPAAPTPPPPDASLPSESGVPEEQRR